MKGGQFYLLTALVLCAAVLSAVFITSVRKPMQQEDYGSNFITESQKVVNSALYENKDPISRLSEFAVFYKASIKSKDPGVGFIFVLRQGKKAYAGSQLAENITINGVEVAPGQLAVFNTTELSLNHTGTLYSMPLPIEGEYALKSLFIFQSTYGKSVRIF